MHKSQERNNPNNYWLISVVGAIAKIFEKIISTHIYDYLASNSLLSESQSGFRSNLSTTTTLLNTTSDWYTSMYDNLLNFVVLLDLKKAFDTVNQTIHLRKLQLYGIKGLPHLWFQSYLSDRQQKCVINGAYFTIS